ncbi:hypothetical protein GCM10010466_07020 [Planomonospora alba]|uniref:Uncharacterized protein n=1 Tax=Planomonospora alba TaxID=161354 RepID=A0ABP6MNJ4_9ACTN
MGQLEKLATDHHSRAAEEWGEAVGRIAYVADEGADFTAEEFARASVAQHAYGWWQQVMDLINGEEVDGAEAIMRTRHRAEQHLIQAGPVCYGDLFHQAMAQARRQAAQRFLTATQRLADALTGPAARAGDGTGHATVEGAAR